MAEFLNLLETIRGEEASIQKLFGGEGKNVSQMPKGKSPEYLKKLAETVQFMNDIFTGRRPSHQLREALSTSDFPMLFGDVIDRQVLANYYAEPGCWPSYCHRSTVPDFRLVNRFAINGGEAVLSSVAQGEEYPNSAVAEARYQYSVLKYGRKMPFNWETLINDDLDALKDIPARFGKAARRSEEKFATQLHVQAGGPHATVYSAAHRNIVNPTYAGTAFTVVNPPLNILGLQEAMAVFGNMLDSDGEPILIESFVLEVPPSLEITAKNIMNAESIWIDMNAVVPGQGYLSSNWMKQQIQLVVNPYLAIVNTTNGGTAWYLHANPGVGRPAFEMGFLRGYETPQIFMKMPNQSTVGGGPSPMDGDFDTDSIEYKVRHIFGGVAEDFKMTVASTGAGV